MALKLKKSSVIPALPGYFTIFRIDEDKKFIVGDPIIAWRIDIYYDDDDETFYCNTTPIDPNGGSLETVSNCVAIQYPNGNICFQETADYDSIEKLNKVWEWG